MTLSRDVIHTVTERIERDPAFTKALLDEAATLFLTGEPDTARLVLRELVNATVGFETLASHRGTRACAHGPSRRPDFAFVAGTDPTYNAESSPHSEP